MHHSKRWVRTYDGRLKRSSHRTIQDRLGDVIRPDNEWTFERDCRDCAQINALHGYFASCSRCREREDYCSNIVKERNGYKCAPRHYRNAIERQYRRKNSQMMAHGRYDILPLRERLNGAGYSWF